MSPEKNLAALVRLLDHALLYRSAAWVQRGLDQRIRSSALNLKLEYGTNLPLHEPGECGNESSASHARHNNQASEAAMKVGNRNETKSS